MNSPIDLSAMPPLERWAKVSDLMAHAADKYNRATQELEAIRAIHAKTLTEYRAWIHAQTESPNE